MPKDDMITRDEAAALTGYNVRRIDRAADDGHITRYKVRNKQWVRFNRAEVLAWFAQDQEVVPADQPQT